MHRTNFTGYLSVGTVGRSFLEADLPIYVGVRDLHRAGGRATAEQAAEVVRHASGIP